MLGVLEIEVEFVKTHFSFSKILVNFFSIFSHIYHVCTKIGCFFRLGMERWLYQHRGNCRGSTLSGKIFNLKTRSIHKPSTGNCENSHYFWFSLASFLLLDTVGNYTEYHQPQVSQITCAKIQQEVKVWLECAGIYFIHILKCHPLSSCVAVSVLWLRLIHVDIKSCLGWHGHPTVRKSFLSGFRKDIFWSRETPDCCDPLEKS